MILTRMKLSPAPTKLTERELRSFISGVVNEGRKTDPDAAIKQVEDALKTIMKLGQMVLDHFADLSNQLLDTWTNGEGALIQDDLDNVQDFLDSIVTAAGEQGMGGVRKLAKDAEREIKRRQKEADRMDRDEDAAGAHADRSRDERQRARNARERVQSGWVPARLRRKR